MDFHLNGDHISIRVCVREDFIQIPTPPRLFNIFRYIFGNGSDT